LNHLPPPTVEEVTKLIDSMPAKSSPLDVIPTSLLKSCCDVFAPLITRLAELSFSEGTFPARYKMACVVPLLKKKDLEQDNPANYRPISNLHTISKVLERLFLSRIRSHVEKSPCFDQLQSAYRRGHSTETALLKLANDIYQMADNKSRTLVVQLDLSAAFDSIDPSSLLHRLERSFGLVGVPLSWIQSYLTDRSQFVRFGPGQSPPATLKYGVPQGSVLGPLLFSLYIAPLSGIIESFGVSHAQYADDTQLYIGLSSGQALATMNDCFAAVHRWLTLNGLSLNTDKSEAIVIGTGARQRHEGEIRAVQLDDTFIDTVTNVRSLGVAFDYTMSFDRHVDNICRTSFHHIRAFSRIRRLMSPTDVQAVATAVVSSRLDYCNSLLFGTSALNIRKLQRVQNCLARLVVGASRSTPATRILSDLHWLPVHARIQYKVAFLTFKTLRSKQPAYLYNLLHVYKPARTLRSCRHFSLQVNHCNTVFASRAFSNCATSVWNSLPTELTDHCFSVSIPVFKRGLKTFLFSKYCTY